MQRLEIEQCGCLLFYFEQKLAEDSRIQEKLSVFTALAFGVAPVLDISQNSREYCLFRGQSPVIGDGGVKTAKLLSLLTHSPSAGQLQAITNGVKKKGQGKST